MPATDAENFLSDLKAVALAGHPLEVGDVETAVAPRRLTAVEIDRFLIGSVEPSNWPARLSSAFRFATQTGERPTGAMGIVFDALAVRLESRGWRERVLRRTGWYLLLLIVTMAVGLAVFFYCANPMFEILRSDLRLMSIAKHDLPEDPVAWVFPAFIGAILLAVGMIVWIVSGGAQRTVWWLGGRSISHWRQTSVALTAIEHLQRTEMSTEQAIELSCDLVAANNATRVKISNALSGAKDLSGIGAWANSTSAAASDWMTKVELWLPLATTTLVGGSLALMYGVLLYKPIISMLYELASATEG